MKSTLLLITLALGSVAAAADSRDLIRLYEEEVLAHDLYIALGKKYPDIRPLQNIPHSEARHRDVMAGILKAEGISVPEAPEGRRFATEGLDKLYRKWLRQGRKSAMAACKAGVRLEDHDIADLRQAQLDFPKHKEALAQLEAASNNHLRAFHRNLTSRGGDYRAEALPAADFTAIVEGEMQPGACGTECENPKGSRGQGGPQGKGGPGKKAGACGDCGSCDAPGAGNGPGASRRQGGRAGQGRGPGAGRGQGPGNGRGLQRRQGPGGPNR